MNKKLFVGGVSQSISDDQIREAFAQAGPVEEVWRKIDRDTGMPAPFAFVTMSDEAGAQAAIDMFNGKTLAGDENGRPLTVNEARPQENRNGGGFGGGSRGGGGGYNRDRRGGGGGYGRR